MKKSSLRLVVLVPVLFSLVVLAASLTAVLSLLAARDLRQVFDERIQLAAGVLDRDSLGRREILQAIIPWFERSGRALQILAARDHDGAVEFGKLAMKSFGTDYFVLTLPDGTVLARAHDPTNFGDSIANQATIQQAMKSQPAVALEEGKVVKLSLRGAVPVLDAKGKLAGIVSTGFTLSQNSYVDGLKKLLGAEVTIFEGNLRLVTTLIDAEGKRIVGTPLGNPLIEETVLKQGKPYFGDARILGKAYTAVYLPIRNDSNTIVGMFFAGIPLVSVEKSTQTTLLVSLAVAVGVLALTALFLVFYLQRRVIRPLLLTADDLGRMSEGAHPAIDPRRLARTDEIGAMSRSLESLAQYLKDGGEIATAISKGNLDVEPRLAGADDQFGHAFTSMTQELNSLIRTIRSAAEEVAEGVRQISDSSQVLSSGATESASSLEEMGASLQQMVGTSGENLRAAREAKTFTEEVSAAAQDSHREMQNLLAAMGAIEGSAQEIQKVVKVIDDIAFQVNLLALNANIEAARAGKFGKGFGVVADEVRALAKRSAEAAKDTGRMVGQALRRIKEGVATTHATGDHLTRIVASIEKVTQTLTTVADQSDLQNEGLKSLNVGMGQLGEVTQSNTATAEQTSAASQEILATADSLKATTARFVLKG